MIERGYLTVLNDNYFSFIMINDEAFDSIIKELGSRKGYNKTISFKQYIQNKLKKHMKYKKIQQNLYIHHSVNFQIHFIIDFYVNIFL